MEATNKERNPVAPEQLVTPTESTCMYVKKKKKKKRHRPEAEITTEKKNKHQHESLEEDTTTDTKKKKKRQHERLEEDTTTDTKKKKKRKHERLEEDTTTDTKKKKKRQHERLEEDTTTDTKKKKKRQHERLEEDTTTDTKKKKKRKHERLEEDTTTDTKKKKKRKHERLEEDTTTDTKKKKKRKHEVSTESETIQDLHEVADEPLEVNEMSNDGDTGVHEQPSEDNEQSVDSANNVEGTELANIEVVQVPDEEAAVIETEIREAAEQRRTVKASRSELSDFIASMRNSLRRGPVIKRLTDAQRETNLESGDIRIGKWLPEEDAILRENLEWFKRDNPGVDISRIFTRKGLGSQTLQVRTENKELRKIIVQTELYKKYFCQGLNRSQKNCYNRAYRIFQDFQALGKWSKEETDRFTALQAVHGNKWRLLADLTGRQNQHLIDKSRNMTKKRAPWTEEQEEMLKNSVKKCAAEAGHDFNNFQKGLPWSVIAEEVEGRTSKQCFDRWVFNVRNKVLNKTTMSCFDWTPLKKAILLTAICRQEVCVEDLVDFREVGSSVDGQPSKNQCNSAFQSMKRKIPSFTLISFPDLLDKLCTLYAND